MATGQYWGGSDVQQHIDSTVQGLKPDAGHGSESALRTVLTARDHFNTPTEYNNFLTGVEKGLHGRPDAKSNPDVQTMLNTFQLFDGTSKIEKGNNLTQIARGITGGKDTPETNKVLTALEKSLPDGANPNHIRAGDTLESTLGGAGGINKLRESLLDTFKVDRKPDAPAGVDLPAGGSGDATWTPPGKDGGSKITLAGLGDASSVHQIDGSNNLEYTNKDTHKVTVTPDGQLSEAFPGNLTKVTYSGDANHIEYKQGDKSIWTTDGKQYYAKRGDGETIKVAEPLVDAATGQVRAASPDADYILNGEAASDRVNGWQDK